MDSLKLKPLSLPHFYSTLAFSPCSPFAHRHGALEARFSATLRLAPPAALSNGRGVAASCPGLLRPRISNSVVNSCAQPLTLKSTKTGLTRGHDYAVSVMQGYQYHEHLQDPDKNKMMTYSKVEKNAKSIVKIKGVHSGFLQSVARKECAANHGRSRDFCNITLQVCVWHATFCANLSHHRVANALRAMTGDCNECDIVTEEDQSQSKDNSKCFPQKKATPEINIMPLGAILFLALILGTRHQIFKIMKSKGLDTKRSVILLSSCLCLVKSVYGALKEAKEAGELVMFYLDVAKKGDKTRDK